MANISFLDLMFAEALASGLARDRAERERPPPDNFFVLPNGVAWRQIQTACKKENMVICIEITRKGNVNCTKVQGIFMDMAREIGNIPFVRVFIDPFTTFDELRSDVGGVQYTPTILALFFDNDSVSRAKYEGFDEIMPAVVTGRLKEVIKELLQRRAKLKMVEGLIAQHLRNQLSDRERRVREDYEKSFLKQMEEKEEALKKREEELKMVELEKKKKRKEEEEEQELERRMKREAEEKLKRDRPTYVKELLEMDLDKASISSLKSMMRNLGISMVGCVEKGDLKKKLVDSVPELRIRVTSKPPETGGLSSTAGRSREPVVSNTEVDTLKRELAKRKSELEQADQQLSALKKENRELNNKARFQFQRSSSDGKDKIIKELQTKLLETRMLYTTCLEDFEVIGTIYSPTGQGQNDSLILRVKCIKPGIPHQDRIYAMKVIANYFRTQTQTQVRLEYQKEYQALCQLPQHENIIHMWAFFYDRTDPSMIKHFKKLGDNARTMSLFILMDEHPQNMADQLEALVSNRGPKVSRVLEWIRDLLSGLLFLAEHNVVHRDLKMDNLLLSANGRLVISDFGKSLVTDSNDLRVPHTSGFDIGGNEAHLAPEILNSKSGSKKFLDYSKQSVWAAGVLAYELAGHKNPFQSLDFSQRSYSLRDLPPLKKTHCAQSSHCEVLPRGLTDLVHAMLDPDEDERPTLKRCLNVI